ncbi:DNA-binding response regulator [Lachnospiraceae bacterium]|nr:DNA-binding response regulator [Lachnospiraceae bacterium]
MEKITVLVVEDEMKLLKTLSDFLTINKYTVFQASDGLNAIQEFNTHREEIDIILLDVMLPFMDGYEVLKQIRLSSNVPVIMLTAKEEVEDQLKGFSCGADDYIIKPYTLSVVKMHMEAVLKRLGYGQDILYAGNIRIEINAKKIYVENEYIETTPKEFELLYILVRNQGKVLTRDFILDNIWGYHYAGDMRTIDTLVKQLRKKLGEVSYIRTVYGVGYCFEVEGNEKIH